MADEIGLFEAIRAPNGGNQQRWRFIVIKDPATKRWIQERYRTTDRPAHAAPHP